MSASSAVVSLSDAKRRAKKREGSGPPSGGGMRGEDLRDSCPIRPLGHRDGVYFFFDPAGQFREITAQQLGQSSQLVALFLGDIEWLVTHFQQLDREGNPTNWFSVRQASKRLIEWCADDGLLNPAEQQRGVGVWRAGSDVAVHLGDRVMLLDRKEVRLSGFRDFGALWPAHPRLEGPAEACGPEPARHLVELFGRWNWEQRGSPDIAFGLYAAGLLGAAIPWRPHGLLIGPQGTGKSSLMELFSAASPLTAYFNDYSEAGLRQMLTGRAIPLILDEAEGDLEGSQKLGRVIEMLRRSSGGRGVQAVRGSAGGTAKSFEVTVSALLGAILPPMLQPQDASRITSLTLRPRAAGSVGTLPSETELEKVRLSAPAMMGRALEGLPRFYQNLRMLQAELVGKGCAPRLADQLGTILAARSMMLEDTPLELLEAHDLAEEFAWLAPTEAQQASDSGPYMALQRLLQSSSETLRSGDRWTIGRWLVDALSEDPKDHMDARNALKEHGLLVARYPKRAESGPLCLYVADTHPRLTRIYEGSRWAGNRWRHDLRQLEGAIVPPDPQWIGSSKPRCVVVPGQHLPRPDHAAPVNRGEP